MRVGVLGVILESNRAAPPATEADFRGHYWLEGEAIIRAARAAESHLAREVSAFVQAMDATGPWTPVPILLTASHPAGPAEAAVVELALDRIRAGLQAAGRLDAVYVANHGAMVATDDDDPDGRIVAAVREVIGPGVPIVVTLDLHANIAQRLVDAADLVVGYRTNPHVDMLARGEEAALGLRLILAGLARPCPVLLRLPLCPPSVALLTAERPYGELIDLGQRRQAELGGQILNVSIFGGFVFSDSAKNGLACVVTARHDQAAARRLARELAEHAWANRAAFQRQLTPITEAVRIAGATNRPPVIFSDAGDNPGGGGSGRTTELLAALLDAPRDRSPKNLLYGSFFDPPLAAEAHAVGLGQRFRARFNRHPGTRFDHPLEAEADVVGLHDGEVTGRLGLYAGRRLHLGPSAALEIGGVTVVVISDRAQTADPVQFEMFGLDLAQAETVVVKSRGHFRAGFRPWFPPERVYEIDTDGLTSPVLERRDWQRLPRPVFPLDPDTSWTPPDW